MSDIYQQKENLRAKIKDEKNSFSSEELKAKSELIIAQLETYLLFKNAKTVMLYWSLADEVHTHKLIKELLNTKRLLLPAIVDDEIIPVEMTEIDQLQEGKFHILEPKNNAFIGKIDIIVVPGVAFDKNGNRLGRGRGFYDRFLCKNRTHTVGLCFDFQLIEKVPIEANDIFVDKIISENNW